MPLNPLLMTAAAIVALYQPAHDTGNSAVRLAQAIGNYAGYAPNPNRIVDYDLVDKKNRQIYPGHVTIQLMSNGQGVFDISINTSSRRAFDFTRCFVFEYPVVTRGVGQKLLSFALARLYRREMLTNGCTSYQVLRRPGDEGRRLPLHTVN